MQPVYITNLFTDGVYSVCVFLNYLSNEFVGSSSFEVFIWSVLTIDYQQLHKVADRSSFFTAAGSAY